MKDFLSGLNALNKIVRWRTHISREASGSLPAIGIGWSNSNSTSKLKLKKAATLPQSPKISRAGTLTTVGKSIQLTSNIAAKIYAAPRLIMHAGALSIVGAVVLFGSTGHPTGLNPLADQHGYASALDPAVEAMVAAKVAEQANLIVTSDADISAKSLNDHASLPTSDDGTLAQSQVVNTAGPSTRGIINYGVQAGDTLASIAAQFNITSDTVRWANNITSETDLKPGQSLIILPISGVRYTVVAGDTAQVIASRFQANAEQVVAFNNAEVSGLQPGQSIVVPDGVIPPPAPTPAPASAPSAQTSTQLASVSSAPIHAPEGSASGGGYSYGYCTFYVATRRSIPGSWGNANQWYSSAQGSGYSVGSTPRKGAIAWTGAGYYGHVAYVEDVSGDGTVTVSEMNWNGAWARRTSRTASASSFRYIY